jgi:hypothetical protein
MRGFSKYFRRISSFAHYFPSGLMRKGCLSKLRPDTSAPNECRKYRNKAFLSKESALNPGESHPITLQPGRSERHIKLPLFTRESSPRTSKRGSALNQLPPTGA